MVLLRAELDVDDLDAFLDALAEVGDRYGSTIQAFDARYVAGSHHLERAVELADRAIERGEHVALDRAIEILLYAAGRRQIERAFEMGVREGESVAVILVDRVPGLEGEETDGLEAEIVDSIESIESVEFLEELEPDAANEDRDEGRIRTFFGVTDAEREASDASLETLVCERVALLDVEK